MDKGRCIVLIIGHRKYGDAQRQVVEVANNMDQDRFDVHVCTLSDYVPLGDTEKMRSYLAQQIILNPIPNMKLR